jgi:hypothetical protein
MPLERKFHEMFAFADIAGIDSVRSCPTGAAGLIKRLYRSVKPNRHPKRTVLSPMCLDLRRAFQLWRRGGSQPLPNHPPADISLEVIGLAAKSYSILGEKLSSRVPPGYNSRSFDLLSRDL